METDHLVTTIEARSTVWPRTPLSLRSPWSGKTPSEQARRTTQLCGRQYWFRDDTLPLYSVAGSACLRSWDGCVVSWTKPGESRSFNDDNAAATDRARTANVVDRLAPSGRFDSTWSQWPHQGAIKPAGRSRGANPFWHSIRHIPDVRVGYKISSAVRKCLSNNSYALWAWCRTHHEHGSCPPSSLPGDLTAFISCLCATAQRFFLHFVHK